MSNTATHTVSKLRDGTQVDALAFPGVRSDFFSPADPDRSEFASLYVHGVVDIKQETRLSKGGGDRGPVLVTSLSVITEDGQTVRIRLFHAEDDES